MRIAFVSANREIMPDGVVPLGLLYVHASCPPGHEREFWDLCFEEDPVAALTARLESFRPDLVALGLRNIQNADYTGIETNLDYYRSLVRAIRATSNARVVLGGGGFSVMPAELMEDLRADFGIAGEGERAFPQLVRALETGEGLGEVESLHYFVGDDRKSNPRTGGFLSMETLPAPDRSLVDRRYYERFGIESVQTKRGCPLKCEYCTYPIIEGSRGRVRAPEAVADEFAAIRDSNPGVRHVFVVDSVFNLPLRHAKEVCRALIERGAPLPWTCYANPIAFDRELAALMAAANCVGMEIGSDSGNEETLRRLRKGFTTGQIVELRRLAREAGLKDCHSFILGTEGEGEEDVEQTLDFIEELQPFAAILLVWVDDREAIDAAYAARRRALRERIYTRIRDRAERHPRWIVPPLGIHFSRRQFRLLRQAGCAGPLWQHLDLIPEPSGSPPAA